MSIYIQLLLVAAVVVYIVDLSGFTDSWRGALQRWLHIKVLGPVKPFDCSLCMTWWSCLIYAICARQISLPVIAYSALLALLSNTFALLWGFISETLRTAITYATDKITDRKG